MKRLIGISALLIAAIGVFVAATWVNNSAGTSAMAEVAALPGLKVGDKAPDFKLKNVDGKMVSLQDFKDAKGYIVTFTCNTCPYAVAYEDRIIELNQKFAAKGYPVVAVMPNDPTVQPGDSFDKMQQRAKEKGFTFPYLFDEGQKVYVQYGATRTPEIYLLDKDLTVRYTGAIDDNYEDAAAVKVNYVANAIAAMEKGEEPNPSFTKAVGCSIKTKKKQ